MKNKSLTKFVFLLGLGAGISTFASADANANSCYQLERLCKMGQTSACNVFVRICR